MAQTAALPPGDRRPNRGPSLVRPGSVKLATLGTPAGGGPKTAADPPPRSHLRHRKLGKVHVTGRRRNSGRGLPIAGVLAACAGVLALVWGFSGTTGIPGSGALRELLDRGKSAVAPETRVGLLDVVDVGNVYEEILAGGGFLSPGLRNAKGRLRALETLQTKAADPLINRISRYLEVIDEGIQQGRRPEREALRLNALVQEGEGLIKDTARLELAWYSLAAGADWGDLGSLTDAAVAARTDSLAKREMRFQGDAGLALGTSGLANRLTTSRLQAEGMSALVTLFQADSWSEGWLAGLKQGADKVSPTASTITRAYRNCAYAVIRLKKAERSIAVEAAPYRQADRGAGQRRGADGGRLRPRHDLGPHQGAGRDRLRLRQCRRVRLGRIRHVHALWRRGERRRVDLPGDGGMGVGALRARVAGAVSRGTSAARPWRTSPSPPCSARAAPSSWEIGSHCRKVGAVERTRTSTGCPVTTSR